MSAFWQGVSFALAIWGTVSAFLAHRKISALKKDNNEMRDIMIRHMS